ncbi:conserved unknown protein [Ectocarpus siliculosus]|uniref:Uncharacterized protein n=1 Tax=Ectocarpus siliculosus TaxID=2880 RepID=D8LGT9_ECTSI|nr:conserved unknown protein [Ectocarpus siliculosus]|eukprot:CBN75792.1 conserved unknown protein [Ectocarpus siliculosus]
MRVVGRMLLGVSAFGCVAMATPSSSGGAVGATAPQKAPVSPPTPPKAESAADENCDAGSSSDDSNDSSSSNLDLTSSDTVAYSSRMIAAARALESRRRDRLFDDPYAELLAGPDAMQTVEDKAQEESSLPPLEATAAATAAAASDGVPRDVQRRLAIRTRFCDDFFEDCAGPRGIKQIVSLGAGMDTRGLRLRASGDTKVFEVDQALVLRVKGALLTQAAAADEVAAALAGFRERRDGGVGQGRVVPVEADLSVEGWQGELFEAGFDPSLPSAWILEGLTMYLEEKELVALLRVLASLSSPGSAFCATCVSAESVERAQNSASPLMGRWKWGSDNPQAFFEANFPEGWSFNGVTCGTPGEFPQGADYGVGFVGKAPAYVIGYFSSSSSSSSRGGVRRVASLAEGQ